MTSAINGSTQANLPQAIVTPRQAPPAPMVDSDGDTDGSRPGEVEQTKATSGSVGTRINTTA